MEESVPADEMQHEDVPPEAPVFLSPDDAVEVTVDDENQPMEEDDDGEEQHADDTKMEAELVEEMSSFQIHSHGGPVYAVSSLVLPDNGLKILTGGGDDRAYLWNSTTQSTTALEFAHSDSVAAVAMHESFLAVGSYDGKTVVYDANGKMLQVLEGPTDIEWLSFHPTGTVLLAGSTDGTTWMFHIAPPKFQCLQVFVGHEKAVTGGSFTKNGKAALTISEDGTLRLWAPKTGLVKHTFRLTEEAGLTCLQIGGGTDEKMVVAGSEDGFAYVCHLASQKVVNRLQHSVEASSVEAVGFLPNNWCATAGMDGILKIWDLNTAQCRHTCTASGGITKLACYDHWVVTTSTESVVRVWDSRNGQLLVAQTGNNPNVVINDLSVQAVGGKLAAIAAGDDNIVRVFDIDLSQPQVSA